MRASLLSQLIRDEQDWDKKPKDRYKYRVYISNYVTDIDIQVPAKEAINRIDKELIERYFESEDCKCYERTYERNGDLGFWEFTFKTTEEITIFDIDETAEEEQEQLIADVQRWFDTKGCKEYPDMEMIESVEAFNDNGVRVTLIGESGTVTVELYENEE